MLAIIATQRAILAILAILAMPAHTCNSCRPRIRLSRLAGGEKTSIKGKFFNGRNVLAMSVKGGILARHLNCWASMDQETQSWLVGVPFDTNHGVRHERLRLSPRHKWELANLTGIVMASTVFFLTPLLVTVPAPESVDASATNAVEVDVPDSVPMQPAVRSVSAPVAAVPSTQSAPVREGHVATPAVQPSGLTISGRSATHAQALRRTTTSLRPTIVRAVNAAPTAAQFRERDRRRKGFSSGLKRVLVGDGRHRVQPFPTP